MFVLYDGPSLLDGKPIVVIATGYRAPSSNTKTGPMIQTYILRKDISPTVAVRTGDDESICGDCPHRKGSCYVLVHQGPRAVWNSYKRHQPLTCSIEDIVEAGRRRKNRLGAYGDPCAAPTWVWEAFTKKSLGFTGYTHQWRTCDQAMKRYCMASVDSEEEQFEAEAMGWRTYRVREEDEPLLDNEIDCPHDDYIKCENCLLCKGESNGRNIAIPIHGAANRRKAFRDLRASHRVVVFNANELRKMPAHDLPEQSRATTQT